MSCKAKEIQRFPIPRQLSGSAKKQPSFSSLFYFEFENLLQISLTNAVEKSDGDASHIYSEAPHA